MPFLPLFDDQYPHLVFSDEIGPLPWTYGRLHELVSESRFVRFESRGVMFSMISNLNLEKSVWNHMHCHVTEGAICKDETNTLFFPDGVVDVPADFSRLKKNSILESFPDSKICTSENSGRVIRMYDTRYEFSLCDLNDGNLDMIFDWRTNSLYWRVDGTYLIEYIILFAASIYLMSCVSVNIVNFINLKPYENNKRQLTVVFCVLTWIMYDRVSNTLRYIATTEDEILLWVLVGFAVMEWALTVSLRVFAKPSPEEQEKAHEIMLKSVNGISLILATLMLMTLRMHLSFVNPYMSTLCVLFGVRSVSKFLVFNFPVETGLTTVQKWRRMLVLLVDMFTFSFALEFGIAAEGSFPLVLRTVGFGADYGTNV